ncbi:HlyD family efflux transporter periplasmic adaptor subunit [Roseovarius sp. SCSIO 43702]|uniref:efflux RND transporter periplasmic adaptor subunit n=1 Tax=Roseovarius sp. SCSIO 43702 TaxID=2823043 RepID=UPI001C738C06|nr:HlyD family efflux transporter periplasmic adaptor subunit [Roseovarius sp. SCSIO 43702]QYX57465.1 HlyD family efflux transporter periplasmic adaptor subunit [Roseovarius sp. SCSIO 43702]
MRFLRQSLTGLVLVSLTLGLLALAAQTVWEAVEERMSREPRAEARRERVFAVHVLRAEAGREVPVLTAFGEVRSRRTLEIRAKTAGTIIELAESFVEGGEVAAGQLLVRIDPADVSAALSRAESDLADAEAETRDAERRLALARDEQRASEDQAELRERALARQRDLAERGVGTEAAVEAAELAVAQARGAVLAARQAVAAAEAGVDQAAGALTRAGIARDESARRLAETEITAPFAGRLSGVDVVEGGLVSVNERLADLVDGDALEVAFRVSTTQYARLLDEEGTLRRAPVEVTLDTFGANLVTDGTITRSSAAVGEGQTGRLVFARLEEGAGLKPGDFVTVRVEEPPLDGVVRLPATALGADGTVLALTGGDRLEAVAVTLLRRQGDDVLVEAPALEGRDVVAERSPLLGAGIKVRPLDRRGETEAGAAAGGGVILTDARRARLIAYVEEARDLPPTEKERLLRQLEAGAVPAAVVERLESRIGG